MNIYNIEKIKCAGYVRVSSPRQIREKELTIDEKTGEKTEKWKEKISLDMQREKITKYAEVHDLKLTKIYADKGISGGTVKDRPGL